MVVLPQASDIFELCSKVHNLNLPVCKLNGLKISYSDKAKIPELLNKGQENLPFAESKVFQAPVLQWRRLTAKSRDCKDVYELTFDISGSDFKFKPGDTIGVLPQNKESDVNFILKHLCLSSKADIKYELVADKALKGTKVPTHIPAEATLRHVLTHCVDIQCLIKKLFLLALSTYTKDVKERKVLEYLSSKEGSASYNSFVLENNLNLVDIFSTFKSCQPPVEIILANLPKLLPRPYSIANSQLVNENLIKICFSVVKFGNSRKGVTTSYLEQIILNDSIENRLQNLSFGDRHNEKVSIYLRKNMNGFLLPPTEESLLLIGPGTGVAPFIGFLEERVAIKECYPSLELGDIWLFFGCRNADLDYLYKKELNVYQKKNVLTRFDCTFSRMNGCEEKYVQDAIKKHGNEVAKFIRSGAKVFVCGDLKTMSKEVRESLKQCLITDDVTEKDAECYITEMEKNKRYIVDIWS